jgi:hypothetical protein
LTSSSRSAATRRSVISIERITAPHSIKEARRGSSPRDRRTWFRSVLCSFAHAPNFVPISPEGVGRVCDAILSSNSAILIWHALSFAVQSQSILIKTSHADCVQCRRLRTKRRRRFKAIRLATISPLRAGSNYVGTTPEFGEVVRGLLVIPAGYVKACATVSTSAETIFRR